MDGKGVEGLVKGLSPGQMVTEETLLPETPLVTDVP